MNKICINDIYTGKPDAKDEIKFDGLVGFVNSYVLPETFNIDKFIEGDLCFITGYKGSGKTALLFYLEYIVKQKDSSTCTSFIFFKDEYSEIKKQELEGFSKRISSSITFDDSELIDNADFDYIWRWLFFKRIISDNTEISNNLFENDDHWKHFYKLINSIKAPVSTKKSVIPPKIKVGGTFKNEPAAMEVSPEFEVDFTKSVKEYNYAKFIDLLDRAEEELSQTTRTDIPYYIFVDELEAYYGEERVFLRDLRFIRDLIFSVKRMNELFRSISKNSKVICSVRTEIINAISRFVISKEMNKVINGFEAPLVWNYNNTNSYQHPIIQILLKRIKYSSDNQDLDLGELYKEWFPENIHGIAPANYILNNSWNKPRDIVRLISSTQSSIKSRETAFNQSVFDSIKKRYSDDSLTEIREELRALYNTDEIELIVSCFSGYKTIFSLNQLKKRIHELFPGTLLETDMPKILQDLYRLGFIGNYLPYSKTYRWQHKGDNGIIFTDNYRLMIHYALHSALSLGGRQDYALSLNDTPEPGDIVFIKITGVIKTHAFASFSKNKKQYNGCIYMKNIGIEEYITDLRDYIKVADEFSSQIIDYDETHHNWNLSIDYSK